MRPTRACLGVLLATGLVSCGDQGPPQIASVASVNVSPGTLGLIVGHTGQLTATPRDAAGNPLSGRTVNWTSLTPAVANVDATGLVTALGAGATTITATSEGKTGSAVVTVSPVPVATVSVTPDPLSLRVGRTGQLTATPRDSAGNALSGRSITWQTGAPGVATVDNTGLVTGAGVGTTTITATSEGKSGSATVTVSLVPVATVSVTPDSLDLTVGQTGQLTATARDSAGNVLSGRSVSWASLNPAVARVSSTGLVTAVGAGTTLVSATSEGKSGMAKVVVHEVPTGLDFAGNVSWPNPSSPAPVFGWSVAHLGTGAPMAQFPATYIWRAYPRQQNGYWTWLFSVQWMTTFNGSTADYYGAHPYPHQPDEQAPASYEIAYSGGPAGGLDFVGNLVKLNEWHTCVLIVTQGASNSTVTFYPHWPDQVTDVLTVTHPKGPAPTDLAIIIGGNPWAPASEIPNSILRGFQYYDAALTLAQVQQEIDRPGSFRTPWYLNLNPTPLDITDKSGNGHDPKWLGSDRPTLWTGSGP